ncbi:MAG: fibronectin type III domain-containing protein, partial [Anaerolineales bacterium]|nr:fibronectin type III domain-containing protein [Anaerolineales bacterium]
MKKLFGCLALIILIIIAILLFVLVRNRAEPAAQAPQPAAQQQSSSQSGAPSQPTIQIVSPATGARVRVGQQFQVHVIATDAGGVTTIAFALNGQLGTPINAPSPQKTFSVAIPVVLPNQGIHTIAVQASNASGAKSQPVAVRVVALQNLSDPTNPGDPPAPVPDVPTDPVLSSGNLPAPVNTTVNFAANPASIAQGQCSTLRWAVEGAREVYFEGVGVTGNEQQQQCPMQTTTYTLTVVFQDGSARNYTATVTVTAAPIGGQAPAAPTNLRVTSTTKTTARIAWTDNANNETGFEIGIEGRDGLSANANATQIEATGLTCHRAYNFRVRALNAAGSSAWSNIVTAQTLACDIVETAPSAPANLRVTSTTKTSARLAWTDNANNETGFEIGIEGSPSLSTNANATQIEATGLTCNRAYNFRVRALNAAGSSAWSNIVTAQTLACAPGPQPPAAPSNLRQATTSLVGKVALQWNDNSNNEDAFDIERVAADGSSTRIATANANATGASVDAPPCGSTYQFQVSARNSA